MEDTDNMKFNRKFSTLIVTVMALSLMVFAFSASAADEDTATLPSINDGRVNKFDIAAPVAIFEHFIYPYSDDVNYGVLDTIEFWGNTGGDSFEKVLEVTRAEIEAASPDTTSVLVASGFGYSLYKEVDGSLTLVAPADAAGNAYQFNWTPSL
jgi:hypothetical protein